MTHGVRRGVQVCLVAASNELPDSEELDALYDRFLLRRERSEGKGGAKSKDDEG